MRILIVVHAVLFALGAAAPAVASPGTLTQPPVPELGAPPRQPPQPKPVLPPAPQRGQMLYENHCMSCHESLVHIRTRQQAKTLPQLRARTLHWAGYLHLRWGGEEIEDVVRYLDSQYYRFERH